MKLELTPFTASILSALNSAPEKTDVYNIRRKLEFGKTQPIQLLEKELLKFEESSYVERSAASYNTDTYLYSITSEGARAIETWQGREKYQNHVTNTAQNSSNSPSVGVVRISKREARAVVVSSAALLNAIELFREKIRSDNELGSKHPRHKEDLISFLDRLTMDIQELILSVPLKETSKEDNSWVNPEGWIGEFYRRVSGELDEYTSPESIAKCAIPTGIVVGFGVIGAIIGGPVGFGAGSLAGQLLIGHAKPKNVADKIEEAIHDPISQ